MADIDSLVDQHGEETVRAAFWLQQKIYKEGLEGIHFSEKAESKMAMIGPALVSKAIRDELPDEIE